MNRKTLTTALVSLLLLAGCGEGKQTNELITINASASYPEKELVAQDFMDVEYVPLETTDDYLTQGDVQAIGNQYIVVKNWVNDGDIFLFDRKSGKAVKKINRKGQGGEEYPYINNILLDEKRGELLVNSSVTNKIYVYDFDGNFLRSFPTPNEASFMELFDYDDENLIGYDTSSFVEEGKQPSKSYYHVIFSKKDGSITRELPIPFEKVRALVVQDGEYTAMASMRAIAPLRQGWALIETSTDTIYRYSPAEDRLSPLILRTSTDLPETFLTLCVETKDYYFMRTMQKEFDFTTGKGFEMANLMYDKAAQKVFEPQIKNADYEEGEPVDLYSHPMNKPIAAYQILQADQLVEAYHKDELEGKLKEVAATLEEDSNPVVLILTEKSSIKR